MGLNAVIERFIYTARSNDTMRYFTETAAVLNSFSAAFTDKPVVILHDIINIMCMSISCPHQTEESFVFS